MQKNPEVIRVPFQEFTYNLSSLVRLLQVAIVTRQLRPGLNNLFCEASYAILNQQTLLDGFPKDLFKDERILHVNVDTLNLLLQHISQELNIPRDISQFLRFTDNHQTLKIENLSIQSDGKVGTPDGIRLWANDFNKHYASIMNILNEMNKQLVASYSHFEKAHETKSYKIVKTPTRKSLEFEVKPILGKILQVFLRLYPHIEILPGNKPDAPYIVRILERDSFILGSKDNNFTFIEALKGFESIIAAMKTLVRREEFAALQHITNFSRSPTTVFIYRVASNDRLDFIKKSMRLFRLVKTFSLENKKSTADLITFTSYKELANFIGGNLVIFPYLDNNPDRVAYEKHTSDNGYQMISFCDPSSNNAKILAELDQLLLNFSSLKSIFRSGASDYWKKIDETQFQYIGPSNIIPLIFEFKNLIESNTDSESTQIGNGILIQGNNHSLILSGEATISYFFHQSAPTFSPSLAEDLMPIECYKSKVLLDFKNNIHIIHDRYKGKFINSDANSEEVKLLANIRKAMDEPVCVNAINILLRELNKQLRSDAKFASIVSPLRDELSCELWKYTLRRVAPNFEQKSAEHKNVLLFTNKLKIAFSSENYDKVRDILKELITLLQKPSTNISEFECLCNLRKELDKGLAKFKEFQQKIQLPNETSSLNL